MADQKSNARGRIKLLIGWVLFLPSVGMLLWAISNADSRRAIHESWQRAAHGEFFDGVGMSYSLMVLLALVGAALIKSAFK